MARRGVRAVAVLFQCMHTFSAFNGDLKTSTASVKVQPTRKADGLGSGF